MPDHLAGPSLAPRGGERGRPAAGLAPTPRGILPWVSAGRKHINSIALVFSTDEPALEGRNMLTFRKRGMGIYVDRSSQRWVVLDPDGRFWIVPSGDAPWEHRQPFHPTEETDLEPVPGHY